MNMRIGLPFSCSFVGKSWYVLVMSMIRYVVVLTNRSSNQTCVRPFM